MTKSETHKYVNSLRSENEKLKAQQKSINNKLTELEESANNLVFSNYKDGYLKAISDIRERIEEREVNSYE